MVEGSALSSRSSGESACCAMRGRFPDRLLVQYRLQVMVITASGGTQCSSRSYHAPRPNGRASPHRPCFTLSKAWTLSFAKYMVLCCFGTAVLWPKGGGHPIGVNIPTWCFPSARVLLRRPSVWLWPKGISPSTIRCCPSFQTTRPRRDVRTSQRCVCGISCR